MTPRQRMYRSTEAIHEWTKILFSGLSIILSWTELMFGWLLHVWKIKHISFLKKDSFPLCKTQCNAQNQHKTRIYQNQKYSTSWFQGTNKIICTHWTTIERPRSQWYYFKLWLEYTFWPGKNILAKITLFMAS